MCEMPMQKDVGQLHSLLGGLLYYRKFLPGLAKRLLPLTPLLEKTLLSTTSLAIPRVVWELSQQLSQPTVLAFPEWENAQSRSYPFLLCCDACQDVVGAVLKH